MRRISRHIGIALVVGAAMFAARAVAGVSVLVGATLFDGTGAEPLPDAVVVIRGDRITDIGPASRVPIPRGSAVHDVTGKWIIPGLIDAHVHFFQSGGLYTRPDVIDLRQIRPYAREIAMLRRALPRTLARYPASGVTSVVDLAGPEWVFALRKTGSTRSGLPRVLLSGPGIAPQLPRGLDGEHAPAIVVRTPQQAQQAVRALAERRPDLLKIWFAPSPGMDLGEEFKWVHAAIDEAGRHGLRVAAHATQLEIARRMVGAGVDILVHSIDDQRIDQDLLSKMRAGNILYIPTLGVAQRYAEVLGQQLGLTPYERSMADPEVVASLDDLAWLFPGRRRPFRLPDKQTAFENLLRVHQAGIMIAAGSDAGNIGTLHGPALHRELELMFEAGLAPADVLIAATRGGAAVMDRVDELGTLEAGRFADLLVLEDNPLADIRNTRRIALVMIGGQIIHCETQSLPASKHFAPGQARSGKRFACS